VNLFFSKDQDDGFFKGLDQDSGFGFFSTATTLFGFFKGLDQDSGFGFFQLLVLVWFFQRIGSG